MKPFPLVTAHTGCMGMPEHSLASLRSALEQGANVYEDDIRVTSDGELVLAHDDEVTLSDGRVGSIAGMTLQQLNDGLAETLTKLTDILPIIRSSGITMNLDIKTVASLEPVFRLVEKHELMEKVFLSGCEFAVALEADRNGRHIRKLLNVDVASFQSLPYADAIVKSCEEAVAAGCFGLNVPYQLVDSELIHVAASRQLAVYVWTVAEEDDMKRMAHMGVASITTRNVAGLMKVKAEWTM
ncbi:putative glycerophosphoryl diester phosphodiesterase 1 [compost metagenome]